jgi:hypothetical protein
MTIRPPTYRFGIFELDLQCGELRKLGTKLKIQEQSVQVLALLLARPGSTRDRKYAINFGLRILSSISITALMRLSRGFAKSCPMMLRTQDL